MFYFSDLSVLLCANYRRVVTFNVTTMCGLQANSDTLTIYFKAVVLGSISINVLECLVAFF